MSEEKMDYSKTLNLPKTNFQMRAGLPEKEPKKTKKRTNRFRKERLKRILYGT